MKNYEAVFQNSRFFIIAIAIAGAVYFGGNARSSNKAQNSAIKINNYPQTCQIITAEKHDGKIKISLQNNNNRAITAYVLSSNIDAKTSFTVKEEFAFSEGDFVILPSQTYEKVIGIPRGLNRQAEINLNLSAVIFDDNSSEGDQNVIRDIEENRLGEKLQLMKALPVLDKFSRLSGAQISSYWNKAAKHDFEVALAASDVESLTQLNQRSSNNERTYSESEQFKLGAKSGKESVLQKYEELKDIGEKQGTSALREGIISLRNFYARMVTKF